MENNCVELFYKHSDKHKKDNLLHFNIEVINEKNIKIYRTKKFPLHFSTNQYFSEVIKQNVYSCVVEYIFRRDLFEKVGRFKTFDLAWSSDTATWLKLSLYGGINTIEGAKVKWRLSNLNISSMSNDKAIVLRKTNASIEYIKWAKLFFKKNNHKDITSDVEKVRWLLIGIIYTTDLSFKEKYKIIVDALKHLSQEKNKKTILLFWAIEELKRKFRFIRVHNA